MICKNCNRENNDNANFCSFCGEKLDKRESSKIDLKKYDDKLQSDEEVVYFDPYDDEEVDFKDYDYEEEVQNLESEQYDEEIDDDIESNNIDYNNKNKKVMIFISSALLILLAVFIISKLDIFKGDSEVSQSSEQQTTAEQDAKDEVEYESSKEEDLSEEETEVYNQNIKETKEIPIVNSECSSILHDSTNKDYGSTRVLDGDFSTVWSEGVSGYGKGEWIRLDFDSIYTIEKIKIVNGLVNKKNGYYNNNRPKSIELRFSNGSTQTMYLEDDNTGYQIVNIDPVDSNYVEFTINSVYYGTKYNDTCIADIEILGY
ncbi:NADase-type glycan-binding domain-containing protein [Intestinibacter sp.]|uniref:NADase-type glycan-binding domain-containing protein n=1 Tax=Intestinibacter sp. TaxID=1965304 RepID=UPI003F15D396